MKKIYIVLSLITLFISILLFDNGKESYFIEYDGLKLALSLDGEKINKLPTGNYFLVNYECNNGTELIWDYDTSTLISNNYNIKDTCAVEFESSPLIYNLVNIGDYILYTGDSTNGCVEPQCSGFNANQTENETGEFDAYGYCSNGNYRFYRYGWRVLYKDNTTNSVYIISAGAPECVSGSSSNSTTTIGNLKTASLKYCNNKYLFGGVCNETTAHPFNGDDFYKFTAQYYGSENARYLYTYNDGGTYGTPKCYGERSNEYCGYNNDLIDIGGYYWFGSAFDASYPLLWNTTLRGVGSYSTSTFGVRPVLKLDSSIQAIGGSGTKTNPYRISERVVME